MKLIDRLYNYFSIKGIAPTALEKELHLSNGYFGKLKKSSGSIGSDILEKIVDKFPDLDLDYILTGKEKNMHTSMHTLMHTSAKSQNETPHFLNEPENEYGKGTKSVKNSQIPYYDIEAAANSPVFMFSDHPEHPSAHIYVPGFDDCTMAMNVWGESMAEKYSNGDIILCKNIIDKNLIMYGNAYVIVTTEHRHLKYIHKHPNSNLVTLRSHNSRFDDFEINKKDILMLFLVKGAVKRDAI